MTSHWQLQPIFGSYVLVAVLAAVSVVLLRLQPSFGRLSIPRRRVLMALRAALVVCLCFVMLRPARITVERRTQTAHVLVLFDASRSMQYRDGDDGKSRWEQQQGLLRGLLPQLKDMGEGFEVELISFAGEIIPQVDQAGKMALRSQPEGEQTDIGGALQAVLERHQTNRLAAVVLISDGAQRAFAPKLPPQNAARQLDRRAAPLYTVALGKSRDESQTRQIRIENLQDDYTVYVKNEFALRVGVRVQGYVNQPIPVTLEVIDGRGGREIVGPKKISAVEDSQLVFVDFLYRPEQAGQYQLRVSAREPGARQDTTERTAFLEVREGGLRVLLLTANYLHAEQKFIQRSLDQSQDIELETLYVPLGADRPVDLTASTELDQFDVFIVGDVPAASIHADNWTQLAELVAEGRGFMMYGGYQSFGPGGHARSAVGDILPLRLAPHEFQRYDPAEPPRADRHLEGPLLMLPDEPSSIMYLAEGDENTDIWRSLKPLSGANKFDRLKDEAIVLAKTPGDDPLLVQGTYQGGRVLAFAADSTHRWFRHGQQEPHKRFWRQAILWLARRDKRKANSVFLTLPQRRFRRSTEVTFQTGLTDESGDLVVGAELRATLQTPDGTTTDVPLQSSVEGMLGRVTETQQTGIYRLTVDALEGGTSIASSYADFSVHAEDFELVNPAANPGLLDLLARATERVGGKSVAPEDLKTLFSEIKASPPEDQIETQSKWQLGDSAWGAWTLFLTLVGGLTCEWYLRKRWGLV